MVNPLLSSPSNCHDFQLHPTLPPIKALPTYESLLVIKELLKANAASIHTMRGSGNHGCLGLILRAPAYNIVAQGTPLVIPNGPCLYPLNNSVTAALKAQALHECNKNLCQWKEYTNVHNGLKKVTRQCNCTNLLMCLS